MSEVIYNFKNPIRLSNGEDIIAIEKFIVENPLGGSWLDQVIAVTASGNKVEINECFLDINQLASAGLDMCHSAGMEMYYLCLCELRVVPQGWSFWDIQQFLNGEEQYNMFIEDNYTYPYVMTVDPESGRIDCMHATQVYLSDGTNVLDYYASDMCLNSSTFSVFTLHQRQDEWKGVQVTFRKMSLTWEIISSFTVPTMFPYCPACGASFILQDGEPLQIHAEGCDLKTTYTDEEVLRFIKDSLQARDMGNAKSVIIVDSRRMFGNIEEYNTLLERSNFLHYIWR